MKVEVKKIDESLTQYTIFEAHPPEIPAFKRAPLVFHISEPSCGINSETIPVVAFHGHDKVGGWEYLTSLHKSVSSKRNFLVITVDYMGVRFIRDPSPVYCDEWAFFQTSHNMTLKGLRPPPRSIMESKNPLRELINYLKTEEPQYSNSPDTVLACLSARFDDDHYDFGLVQALDYLWAIGIAKDCYPNISWRHLTGIGLSHGGYLATQCARFAPNTFALIVNGYGWVKPFLGRMLKELRPTLQNRDGFYYATYLDNYWTLNERSPFFLSEARILIRTQNDLDQLKQWKNQQDGLGPQFVMTHQLCDELHPKAAREDLINKMKECGFLLDVYWSDPDPEKNFCRSLAVSENTSFKGFIYDFVTIERLSSLKSSGCDFARKSSISYKCDDKTYTINYRNPMPRLSVS